MHWCQVVAFNIRSGSPHILQADTFNFDPFHWRARPLNTHTCHRWLQNINMSFVMPTFWRKEHRPLIAPDGMPWNKSMSCVQTYAFGSSQWDAPKLKYKLYKYIPLLAPNAIGWSKTKVCPLYKHMPLIAPLKLCLGRPGNTKFNEKDIAPAARFNIHIKQKFREIWKGKYFGPQYCQVYKSWHSNRCKFLEPCLRWFQL